MRNAMNVFHLAIPSRDLGESEQFLVEFKHYDHPGFMY